MSKGMSLQETEDIAEKGFKCAGLIFKFMSNRWENSLRHIEPKNLRETILIGFWQRAYCWLKTLAKLNQTSDFQAVGTASRALFEIYIDMTLIIYDKTNEKPEKLYWWHQSEKLKAFELEVIFQQKNNLITDESIYDFISDNKVEIEANRVKFWGKTKHPDSGGWIGKGSLKTAQDVDNLCLSETKKFLGFGLEHFYQVQYRRIHWDVHSGITSVYGYEPQKFALNNFGYFWNSSNLGILCTKLILTEFGYAQAIPNFEEEFTKLRIEQIKFLPKFN